ncbi:MAG: methyltransferase domain-containing protein [Angelakisella sp.]|nr:methyltransferase domain-containing protein [Angelakisella sp.]
MNTFLCPVCHSPLARQQASWRCIKGHSFDMAAQGYVNLLLSSQKHAKIPGDSKEMVSARERFLAAGYYGFLRNRVAQEAAKLLKECQHPFVVDAGCGEGWYTAEIAKQVWQSAGNCTVMGLDISKFALKSAAKKDSRILWAVASIFSMPVADASADLVVNIFAPIAGDEFARVLKKGGYLMTVAPGPNHLFALKKELYDTPYRNGDVPVPENTGDFSLVERIEIGQEFTVNTQQLLQDLFQMTPYCWKSPREAKERLAAMDSLSMEGDFVLCIYRRR